ncbi:hypothetical protein JBF12_35860, partial [Streptomyces javensis]|nr:hypothetical protein [Streptomyces javensis]
GPEDRPKNDDKPPTKDPKDQDPTKPKPEPPAKPKPETQTKPKPDKDGTPGSPKDDKGPEDRPKNDDKPPTKDPKDQDPTKPKPDKDDDKPTRPKKDDGKKPKPDKDGDKPSPRKPKPNKDSPGRRPNKKGPDRRKPHPDKSGPGRPKSKQEKDRHKKEEDSRESKGDRLDEIIARIRPRINEKLLPGIVEKDLQEMLDRLQSWYRLTGLEKRGGKNFSVIASLNPDRISNTGHEEEEHIVAHDQNAYKTYVNYLEEQKDPDLPSPVAPDFNDDQLASNFEAKYLNRLWAKKHGEWISQDAHLQIPKPFQYILQNDLNQRHPKGRWVRMHMLPAALGGPAKGSNLVPARSTVNNPEFYQKIEKFAEARIAEEDDTRDDKLTMISYKINLTYHKAEIEGFPRTIEAEWKTYDYDRSKKDWDEVTPVAPHKHDSGILEPPPTREGDAPEVYLNSYDAMKLRKLLGISKEFASAITKVRNNGTKPQSVAEVIERIENDPEITLAGEAFNEGKALLVQEQNRINWGTHRRR